MGMTDREEPYRDAGGLTRDEVELLAALAAGCCCVRCRERSRRCPRERVEEDRAA